MSTDVLASSPLNHAGSRTYLSLSFLPFPHGSSREIPEDYTLLLGERSYRRFEIRLRTPGITQWHPFEPYHVEKDGIRFDLEVSEPNPGELIVMYTYRCPYVRIDDEHRAAYNAVNADIARNLKRTLIHGTD